MQHATPRYSSLTSPSSYIARNTTRSCSSCNCCLHPPPSPGTYNLLSTLSFCWKKILYISKLPLIYDINRKVAGSILAGVIRFFIDIKSSQTYYGPGVESASNRNEYQEHFLGGKGDRCVRLITYHHPVSLSRNLGTSGPLRTCNGTALPFYSFITYLLTTVGLTPGGSSTVHRYTQTVHRTTQLTQTAYRTTQQYT